MTPHDLSCDARIAKIVEGVTFRCERGRRDDYQQDCWLFLLSRIGFLPEPPALYGYAFVSLRNFVNKKRMEESREPVLVAVPETEVPPDDGLEEVNWPGVVRAIETMTPRESELVCKLLMALECGMSVYKAKQAVRESMAVSKSRMRQLFLAVREKIEDSSRSHGRPSIVPGRPLAYWLQRRIDMGSWAEAYVPYQGYRDSLIGS